MGMIEFALVVSAVIALYNFQQIKMTLKDKGYEVNMFTGWLGDYRRYKSLIGSEEDEKMKLKYQKILNGLLFSLCGLIFFALMMVRKYL